MRDIVPVLAELLRNCPGDAEARFVLRMYARAPLSLDRGDRLQLHELARRRGESPREELLATAARYVLSRLA